MRYYPYMNWVDKDTCH